VKAGLAQMLKGGVIMDVIDAEQARIAEEAGAVAVMALERCALLNPSITNSYFSFYLFSFYR
jgi:pyridoxal biosynthesis lyase PdxS